MGFTDKGIASNPMNVVTKSDLETNFGTPTNEAEAYFYNASMEVLNEGGVLWAVKLPYDNDFDSNYKFIGLSTPEVTAIADNTALKARYHLNCMADTVQFDIICNYKAVTYTVGNVTNMTNEMYDVVVAGNGFEPAVVSVAAGNDFIIVNEMKQTINGLKETDETDGLFVVAIDPFDGMDVQRTFSHEKSDTMNVICSLNGYSSNDFFYKKLTDSFAGTSYSEDFMGNFPQVQYANYGETADPSLFKSITLLVVQSKADPNAEGKMVLAVLEAFSGSLNPLAKNKDTGISDYIGNYINNGSKYIKLYHKIDADGALDIGDLADTDLIVNVEAVNEAYDTLTFTRAEGKKWITGSKTINDVNSALEKLGNIDDKDIDIVADAGLTTIAHYCTSKRLFAPAADKSVATLNSPDSVATWRTMAATLINFAQNIRKDCIAVIDVPRNFALETVQKKLRKTAPANTFSNTLAPQIKYMTGLNSSYAAMYSDWMKIYDTFRGIGIWLPPSIKAVGIFCRTDRIANYWEAPAGLNRGVIAGITDIAFNPIEKESSQLYTKGMNFCKWYNGEGFILEGQRTTQVKPSAFDRINVRRLFLRLERQVYKMARYYVMELNTQLTRRKFQQSCEGILQPVKLAGGMYDYQVVCDDSVNTPDVIDNNELRCVIKIKPTKVIEFIIVDFVALSTKGNFSEV